ncbi:response regulator [Pedobacter sp. AW1-32]|uniref:response regulator n=1 Tax=Pedobacter sp. AW1-32 TaxID=3383026 RepID=UPI003FF03693
MEGSKILISLNNEVIAKRISNILTESKYLPIVNNDGNKVMEMLRKQEIDLVICGSELSGLGGMGVLKLKNKFIDTSNISFIMLIDQDDRDLMRECMELGADGMLLNPFKDVELLNQIETRLKKSSFATELYERKWLSAKAAEREADAIEWLFDRIKNLPSRIFKKNQVIYHMDEKLNGIQLVLTGKVKTYISDDFGNSIITDIYREAQYFGIEGLYPDLSTHHMP